MLSSKENSALAGFTPVQIFTGARIPLTAERRACGQYATRLWDISH